MIKSVSEFKEFLFSKTTASLGMLGGTPGARAALRAAAKAEAKAKAKSAASTRYQYTFLSAFAAFLGGACCARPAPSIVAEETFGKVA